MELSNQVIVRLKIYVKIWEVVAQATAVEAVEDQF